MPTFKGSLSAEDVSALVAFLKSLSGEEAGEKGKEAKGEEVPGVRKEGAPAAGRGEDLVQSLGCLGCHTTDGSRGVGPTWKGLYGSRVEITGGGTVTADEVYLRESILNPGAKIVKGFPDAMPSFEGQIGEEDLPAILAYIKTLK
jgi:cytochrome c oxidase subunit 2